MTETQKYRVVAKHPGLEVRRYEACVVAEVVVTASAEDAANRAFRSLAGYIGGRNRGKRSIAMTAPVLQQPADGRSIAMTAPVLQREADESGQFVVGFVMPAKESIDTLPEPMDPAVSLRTVPLGFVAARRYSGRWTEERFSENLAALDRAVRDAGLVVTGPPQWARYDPPWKPWFLRRNEVLRPIASPSAGSATDAE